MKKSRAKTTKNRMEIFHLQEVINSAQFNLLHILVSHRRTCTSQKLQLSAQNNQTKPPQPNKAQLLKRFPEGNSGREMEVNQPKERSTRNDSRQNLKGKQYLCPSVELHVFLCSPNWVADLAGKFSPTSPTTPLGSSLRQDRWLSFVCFALWNCWVGWVYPVIIICFCLK